MVCAAAATVTKQISECFLMWVHCSTFACFFSVLAFASVMRLWAGQWVCGGSPLAGSRFLLKTCNKKCGRWSWILWYGLTRELFVGAAVHLYYKPGLMSNCAILRFSCFDVLTVIHAGRGVNTFVQAYLHSWTCGKDSRRQRFLAAFSVRTGVKYPPNILLLDWMALILQRMCEDD